MTGFKISALLGITLLVFLEGAASAGTPSAPALLSELLRGGEWDRFLDELSNSASRAQSASDLLAGQAKTPILLKDGVTVNSGYLAWQELDRSGQLRAEYCYYGSQLRAVVYADGSRLSILAWETGHGPGRVIIRYGLDRTAVFFYDEKGGLIQARGEDGKPLPMAEQQRYARLKAWRIQDKFILESSGFLHDPGR
jgi:hypothetical protein